MIYLISYIITGIIFGGFCAFVANEKNRDGAIWFGLGFIFQLVALIALVGVPKIDPRIAPKQRKGPGASAQKGECGDCIHFEKTGLVDQYKGKCHFHNQVTYKNHGCEYFSHAKEENDANQAGE